MAIFFCLSGFLITGFLLRGATVTSFLIRRFCRILPLAWIAIPIGLWMSSGTPSQYLHQLLFVANLPPFWLTATTGHFWSLCVEMQFYISIAIVYGFLGKRGLYWTIPIAAALVTGIRVYSGAQASIVTYERVDEILAGAILAMLWEHGLIARFVNVYVALALFSVSTLVGPLMYARPYLAALMVGTTLWNESALTPLLVSRSLAYIAEISYALYVWHPLLGHTWLGDGDKLIKYLKRPFLIGGVFLIAHISTFAWEKRWTEWAKTVGYRVATTHS
jgi:peptidoglycan/LPS O-acetylase OafA/YrhL